MSEVTMTAPKFDVLLHSSARPDTQSIVLVFGSVDKRRFALEFSAQCVPIAIAAMAAEMGKIASTVPQDTTPTMQGIRAVGTTLAMKDDGTIALLLRLESGAELPLEFQQTELSKLRDQIEEAMTAADRMHRH
jgi:hypothetical protein